MGAERVFRLFLVGGALALDLCYHTLGVVPAEAGTRHATYAGLWTMGPRFRGDDRRGKRVHFAKVRRMLEKLNPSSIRQTNAHDLFRELIQPEDVRRVDPACLMKLR